MKFNTRNFNIQHKRGYFSWSLQSVTLKFDSIWGEMRQFKKYASWHICVEHKSKYYIRLKARQQVVFLPSFDTCGLSHSEANAQIRGLALSVYHDTRNRILNDLLNKHKYCVLYKRNLLLKSVIANAILKNTKHFCGLCVHLFSWTYTCLLRLHLHRGLFSKSSINILFLLLS